MSRPPTDYVEVADRLSEAFDRWPEASMQGDCVWLENPPGWLATAYFYRSPDDPRPGVGHAFEPTPGKTAFTRDSECMNAETSAWGRALVAVGLKTKHIASANEVRNRREQVPVTAGESGGGSEGSLAAPDDFDDEGVAQTRLGDTQQLISEPQSKMLHRLIKKCEGQVMANGEPFSVDALRAMMQKAYGVTSKAALTKAQASDLITRLKALAGEE